MSKIMNYDKLFLGVKVLAILGIALAAYLLWEQSFPSAIQPCRINSNINCDAIISGEVSKTLGVPTPLYGLIGYLVILFAAVYRKPRLLLGVASFGLAFCLWIGYRELFQLKVVCPICIGCQSIMVTVFILSLIANKNKPTTI